MFPLIFFLVEQNFSQLGAGACLEHFRGGGGGDAGALPPNGVAASDKKKAKFYSILRKSYWFYYFLTWIKLLVNKCSNKAHFWLI